jgi:cAMP phosphodiesterase
MFSEKGLFITYAMLSKKKKKKIPVFSGQLTILRACYYKWRLWNEEMKNWVHGAVAKIMAIIITIKI